jgi:hypothetical protein
MLDVTGAEGVLATGGAAVSVGLGVSQPASNSAVDKAAKLIKCEILSIEVSLLQIPARHRLFADALPWNLRSNAFVAKKSQKTKFQRV